MMRATRTLCWTTSVRSWQVRVKPCSSIVRSSSSTPMVSRPPSSEFETGHHSNRAARADLQQRGGTMMTAKRGSSKRPERSAKPSRAQRVAGRLQAELMDLVLRGALHDPGIADTYVTKVQ